MLYIKVTSKQHCGVQSELPPLSIIRVTSDDKETFRNDGERKSDRRSVNPSHESAKGGKEKVKSYRQAVLHRRLLNLEPKKNEGEEAGAVGGIQVRPAEKRCIVEVLQNPAVDSMLLCGGLCTFVRDTTLHFVFVSQSVGWYDVFFVSRHPGRPLLHHCPCPIARAVIDVQMLAFC